MRKNFSITNNTKSPTPKISFEKIKEKVLGENYNLSLVFVGKETSRKLNSKYRGKNKETNVLSFPIDKKEGEIFINLRLAEKQKEDFGMNYKNFVIYLFIHGLLHLKGMEHGSRMERAESKLLKQFKL